MITGLVVALEKRAKTLLPPATVMRIECAGDASGDPALIALLDEVEQKGLAGEELCSEPCETIVFEDRILLRCAGCKRMGDLPRFAGIGRGRDADEARRNALFALTLPFDHPNAQLNGCLAAQCWGSGSVEDIQYACAINRAAYLHGLP